ncbi:sensor histidine kinase [Salinivirga cyanobacteriivorans]
MKIDTFHKTFTGKRRWLWHILYWILAALILLFVFINPKFDLQIRLVLVASMIVVSYFLTWLINYILIPRFLFKNKIWTFIYLVFGGFIFTMWINFFASFGILIYSAYTLPELLIPNGQDILILLAGNYIIVFTAVVIHFIRESYRRMNEKNEIEKQRLLAESKLKDAQMKLLQGQIHPHFLFNMLNNLYGLIKKDTKEARTSILKLSDLLDYMLYKGEHESVDLNSEITFIENYIALEKLRHDKSFTVQFNYPKNIEGYKIPPLLLFPLVENAFKHSSSGVKLALDLEGNQLMFRTQNNYHQTKTDKYLNSESNGIGLKNTSERLAVLFPEKHNLQIQDNGETFIVDLKITLTNE